MCLRLMSKRLFWLLKDLHKSSMSGPKQAHKEIMCSAEASPGLFDGTLLVGRSSKDVSTSGCSELWSALTLKRNSIAYMLGAFSMTTEKATL